MTFKGLFQLKRFYDSVILHHKHNYSRVRWSAGVGLGPSYAKMLKTDIFGGVTPIQNTFS